MNKRGLIIIIVGIILVIFIIGIFSYIFIIPSESEECIYKQCPEGYVFYGLDDCGFGPDGPVLCPSEIRKKWDCECHKICGYEDTNCPSEMPDCKEVQISDTIMYLCFE